MFFGHRIFVFQATIIRQKLQKFRTKIDDQTIIQQKEKRLIRAELHLTYGVTPTRVHGEFLIKAKAVKSVYLPCKPQELEMIIADDNPAEWSFENLLDHSYQIQEMLQANEKLMLFVAFSSGDCSTLDELNQRDKYLKKHGWTVIRSDTNIPVSNLPLSTSC